MIKIKKMYIYEKNFIFFKYTKYKITNINKTTNLKINKLKND